MNGNPDSNVSAFSVYSKKAINTTQKSNSRKTRAQNKTDKNKASKKIKFTPEKELEPEIKQKLKLTKVNSQDDFVEPTEVPKKSVKSPKTKPILKANKKKIVKSTPTLPNEKDKQTINKENKQITHEEAKQTTFEEVETLELNSEDSVETGRQLFSWLISPVEEKKFFKSNWEKQPLCIKRKCPAYYSYLLSGEEIDKALRKQKLYFTKNIDITSYSPDTGLRETHNPPGRATAPLVWDYYSNGCSIRILNPQTFFPKIHALNSTLQEYFGNFVGANVYLTPAGTQGFAPHYDDIEAFVLQIEGEKLWKLYPPRSPAETLPRFSSGNFTESDLGPPLEEVLLKPGDMLYFPRGIIHQGKALEHTHSLHITLSMYQKNSWADLLETLLPAALKSAVEEDVSFREGLPMHYLSHMGVVNSDRTTNERARFINKLQGLITRLVNYAPVDAAVDQLGKRFIHDSLPPYLRSSEVERSVFGDGEKIKKGNILNQAEMSLDTRIKLLRFNCVRIVREDDAVRIYYSVNNSMEYHGEELQFLEIDEDLAPAVDALILHYPNFLAVEDFPIEDDIAKVQIASDLWDHGLLITEEPIGYSSD